MGFEYLFDGQTVDKQQTEPIILPLMLARGVTIKGSTLQGALIARMESQ